MLSVYNETDWISVLIKHKKACLTETVVFRKNKKAQSEAD